MAIGETLRQARLGLGLELLQVSQQTKIASRYLEAIEKDDRHSLPAGFFYRNWVVQYAAFLSLDTFEIAAEVDRVTNGDQEPALPGQDSLRLPADQRPIRLDLSGNSRSGHRTWYSIVLLVLVTLGCSGLYSWWRANQALASSTLAPEASSKAPDEAQTADRQAARPAPEAPSEAAVAPAATPAVEAPDLQIELTAIERTWVSLAPDGKESFSGVLQPAQVQSITAHENARIRVGNAAGVSLRVNGKDAGPVGAPGQVRLLLVSKDGVEFVEPRAVVRPISDDRTTVGSPISQ